MKLSTLKFFIEVASEGSFTRASQKLYISQPTLSRRIQELEAELGVTLFIRHSHTLTLSSEGEQFFTAATDVLNRVDQLTHMFDPQNNSENTSQLIKIGYLPNFNLGRLYNLLDSFKAQHPNVTFLMKPSNPLSLADGLIDRSYDLVLDLEIYFQHHDQIEKLLFNKNRLQIAVPINHPLGQQKSIHFSELNQESFILLERKESPIIVDYVVSQFINYGFNVRANSYVKTLDEGLAKVSIGEGLAFLYSGMNDGTLEAKYHIKIIDLDTNVNDQNIIIAYNPKNLNYFSQKLAIFLRDQLSE